MGTNWNATSLKLPRLISRYLERSVEWTTPQLSHIGRADKLNCCCLLDNAVSGRLMANIPEDIKSSHSSVLLSHTMAAIFQ